MSPISRGFHRRHEEAEPAGRVPPGQYVTHDFPVLSAGPTPHTPLANWTFSIEGGSSPVSWTWSEFQALPAETVTVDIHCVTRWSKLDTSWTGVSLDVLLDAVSYDARYVLAFCDGGYTTNLPVADLRDGKAWVAYSYDGNPLRAEHGGPARLTGPGSHASRTGRAGPGRRARPPRDGGGSRARWDSYPADYAAVTSR